MRQWVQKGFSDLPKITQPGDGRTEVWIFIWPTSRPLTSHYPSLCPSAEGMGHGVRCPNQKMTCQGGLSQSSHVCVHENVLLHSQFGVLTVNCGEFWKRWGYQTTLPASWKICMQVKKQKLKLDVEHQTGSKLGKEYVKAVYCHPACLICMQSTSWETLDWKKHKLESRLPGEISTTLDIQMIPL